MDKREVLGTCTLEDGTTVKIHMPTMGKIMGIFRGEGKALIEYVVPAATGQTLEWFYDLSLLDGLKVVKAISPIMSQINEMFESLTAARQLSKVH